MWRKCSVNMRIFLGESAVLSPDKKSNKYCIPELIRLIAAAIFIIAICFALVLIKPWKPIIRFDSEMIRVTVDPERITVDGLYRLYNPLPFPMVQHFFYPIPEGGGLEPADQILIESSPDPRTAGSKHLTPVLKDDLKYYRVTVPGGGTLNIRAVYSQRHGGRYGRYILTTTGSWGRPLRRAKFELELDSVDFIDSNYELSGSNNGALTFQRSGFMPDEDWVFTFKRVGDIS